MSANFKQKFDIGEEKQLNAFHGCFRLGPEEADHA